MLAYLTVPRGGARALSGVASRAVVFPADESEADLRAAARRLRAAPDPPTIAIALEDPHAGGSDARLAALAACRPDVLLAPVAHGRDVAELGSRLAVAEAEAGLPDGSLGILAWLRCAPGVLAAGTLPGSSRRLRGVGWDAGRLAEAIGAGDAALADARDGILAQARALVRFAAAAAGVPAIETVWSGDDAGLHAVVAAARRDGFSGMLARTPAQARVIEGR